jgi:hypothetical protein
VKSLATGNYSIGDIVQNVPQVKLNEMIDVNAVKRFTAVFYRDGALVCKYYEYGEGVAALVQENQTGRVTAVYFGQVVDPTIKFEDLKLDDSVPDDLLIFFEDGTVTELRSDTTVEVLCKPKV